MYGCMFRCMYENSGMIGWMYRWMDRLITDAQINGFMHGWMDE